METDVGSASDDNRLGIDHVADNCRPSPDLSRDAGASVLSVSTTWSNKSLSCLFSPELAAKMGLDMPPANGCKVMTMFILV